MKNIVKWVCRVVEAFVIVYVVIITSLILMRNKFGYTEINDSTYISVTKNNTQNIAEAKNGDLLVIKNADMKSINLGDKIYYYATINDNYVIESGFVSFKTADDTKAVYVLNNPDKTSVSSTRVIGKEAGVKKNVGGILTFLESRVGFLLCVLLPILLIFIYQIYDLVVTVKYDAKGEKQVKKDAEKTVETEAIVKEEKQDKIAIPEVNESAVTVENKSTEDSSNDDIDMI